MSKNSKVRESGAKIDLQPDAWSRFERAVDVVAKSPPQPKIKSKAKKAKSPNRKNETRR
jgi:hypothetical protein